MGFFIIFKRLETQHLNEDKEKSRLYHQQLDEHFQLMKQNEEEEKRKEREKSVEVVNE